MNANHLCVPAFFVRYDPSSLWLQRHQSMNSLRCFHFSNSLHPIAQQNEGDDEHDSIEEDVIGLHEEVWWVR